MAKKTSVQFYYEYIEQLQDLDDKQFRKVLEAMVIYDETGKIIELDSITKMAFNFIKKRIDYDKDTYNKKCEKNKQNIQNYWNERKQSNTNEYEPIRTNTKNTDIDIELDLDIDKDIELDNNIITDDTDNNIYNYIESNFGRTLSPVDYETISEWEDNELTRYAIKKAVINNKCSIGYIEGILKGFKRNNITTVQQAQDEEEQFRKRKEESSKYKGLSFKEQERLREEEKIQKWLKGES